MTTCDDGHQEIVYNGRDCPLCDAHKDNEDEVKNLTDEIQTLKDEIEELQNKINDLTDKT